MEDRNVRKIYKHDDSYAVTLPIELVRELKWKVNQKVVAKKYGDGILIKDWK
ncbi:AbrB/MazE/SpoVT family DNA-binding domain-containing protein [bacterium]|nr:MAG: AbrB/MazE/SpoVT family DNA-binding domain-containing protein [bacterium]